MTYWIGGLLFGYGMAAVFYRVFKRKKPTLRRYFENDTFETHECIICKRDLDASWCIPKPVAASQGNEVEIK